MQREACNSSVMNNRVMTMAYRRRDSIPRSKFEIPSRHKHQLRHQPTTPQQCRVTFQSLLSCSGYYMSRLFCIETWLCQFRNCTEVSVDSIFVGLQLYGVSRSKISWKWFESNVLHSLCFDYSNKIQYHEWINTNLGGTCWWLDFTTWLIEFLRYNSFQGFGHLSWEDTMVFKVSRRK